MMPSCLTPTSARYPRESSTSPLAGCSAHHETLSPRGSRSPSSAQPVFPAYSQRCDQRHRSALEERPALAAWPLLSVPSSEGLHAPCCPPARNSSNPSPEKSSAACSMNVASASETPYGSIPSAPAASQNARSSGLSSDRDKRAQRRATSLSDRPAVSSLAATPSMNFARIDSAAPRDIPSLPTCQRRRSGFVEANCSPRISNVEPSNPNVTSGRANPVRYLRIACSRSRPPKIDHQSVARPSAKWTAGTVTWSQVRLDVGSKKLHAFSSETYRLRRHNVALSSADAFGP